ncbi:MarR family winged helix-turn-helix transcriptional regulator [Pseudomonas solani]|uniref:MarR family winged helix-turn-helix transcriptional regulator n=1 Tax=Pseudomonas solani TaxID=2731552 RepID=UPI003C2FC715
MTADTAEDVFESIHSVMHLYRARQYRTLRDGAHDLAHMEFKALNFFAHNPGATQSDLVAHSGRDKAQIARLIQALRAKALLEGKADEADKRSIRLYPTAAGTALHQEVRQQGRRLNQVAVDGFSQEECQQLLDLLARVQANLGTEA